MFSKLFKPSILQSLVRANGRMVPKVRSLTQNQLASNYFGSLEVVNQAKRRLAKSLEKEIKFEDENYAVDESIKEFLKETGFQLAEKEDDNNLELVKNTDDVKVVIQFQSRSPQVDEQGEQQEEGQNTPQTQQNEENEQDQLENDFCEFTVLIIKPTGEALVYECYSIKGEITINSAHMTQNAEVLKKQSRYDRVVGSYIGPDFTTLDDKLQQSLFDYLKSFGINEEVAEFIEHVSLDKEQRLYMKWLKDVKNFIQ